MYIFCSTSRRPGEVENKERGSTAEGNINGILFPAGKPPVWRQRVNSTDRSSAAAGEEGHWRGSV